MIQTSYDGLDEMTFRAFLLWYLIAYGMLIGLGALCLGRAIGSGGGWWGGVGVAVLAALVLAARYNAQAVIIRGNDLVLRTGTLNARERIFPIWLVDLEIEQGLPGRLFDYATIQVRGDTQAIAVPMIASVRALRFLVAQRRLIAIRMLAEQHLVTLEYARRSGLPARSAALTAVENDRW